VWKLKNQRYDNKYLGPCRLNIENTPTALLQQSYSIAGFTMAEIIVALAILSISVLAVFTVMRTCSTAAHHTRMLTKSVLLAESLLTEAKLNKKIAFETAQGRQDPYSWQIQTAPTGVENLAAICVQVKWTEQQRQQKYELVSLIHITPLIEGK